MLYSIKPEDMAHGISRVNTLDGSVAYRIKYIGSAESGLLTISSAGDHVFVHGALGSEAADTTVNPNGGTPGTIDVSAEATTFAQLKRIVDESANWEFIPIGILPTDAPNTTTTTHLVAVTTQQCNVAAGYAVYIDRSATLYNVVGVTFNGPSSEPHGSDSQSHNEINYLSVTLTFAGGTHTIYVYEVDDVAGTATLLDSFGSAATTVAKKIPVSGTQGTVYSTENKRLVVKQASVAGEPTATEIEVHYSQHQFGPSVRASKMASSQ